MKCPSCNVNLVMADRSGIEIDYCPECRGVWLDRGELDKIIERSVSVAPIAQSAPRPAPQERSYIDRDDRRGYDNDDYRHKKKPKGLLGEIFDF